MAAARAAASLSEEVPVYSVSLKSVNSSKASEINEAGEAKLVTAVLPWLIGAGALLVYLLTLNGWVSLYSLGNIARVSGWTWQPELYHPLTALALCPFELLPPRGVPLALNIFTAVCAALVLVLLARSVALLPYELPALPGGRPEPGPLARLLPHAARMASLLAVAACGLQSTFWEHATSASGEMLDLLLFAYIIRCLLEFRTDRRESWLTRAAFLYGAGMANTWVLLLYSPLFLIAFVRLLVQRVDFGYLLPNPRWLGRLLLWLLAGLSVYLLLPVLQSLSSDYPLTIWKALKANLKFQWEALTLLRRTGFGAMALTTAIPVLVLCIRWKMLTAVSSGDSAVAAVISRAANYFLHAAILAASLWLMLDPPFSPRHSSPGASPLFQYYLYALVAGDCAGFVLVAAQVWRSGNIVLISRVTGQRRVPLFARIRRYCGYAVGAALGLALGAMPLMLALRNAGSIRTTNGPALREFARELCRGLPPGRSIVLSDDPTEQYLMRAELEAAGHDKGALLLDTRGLGSSQYQFAMAQQFGARWPLTQRTPRPPDVKPTSPRALLLAFPRSEPRLYSHPSFDYPFELFAERPDGLLHWLLERPVTTPPGAKLEERTAAANDQYWRQQWTNSLEAMVGPATAQVCRPPRWVAPLFLRLHLATETNRTAAVLGAAYARCLDYWGVQLQRLDRWQEAGLWFGRALKLNPGNLAARINLEFNERYQHGGRDRLEAEAFETQFAPLFAKYRAWGAALEDNGPVDEPTFLLRTAAWLRSGRNYVQAAGEFTRCAELAPGWLEPKLGLAECKAAVGDFDAALRMIDNLQIANPPQTEVDEARVSLCRANALQGLGRREEASTCVAKLATEHAGQPEVLATAVRLCLQGEQYAQALTLLEALLQREPNSREFLSNKGIAEMGLQQYDAAAASFTRALTVAPSDPAARINRAISFLRGGQLDAARADYQDLRKRFPNSYQVLYGLGEIAWRKQDTNTAVELYQRYVSASVPGSDEYRLVCERLETLHARSPAADRNLVSP